MPKHLSCLDDLIIFVLYEKFHCQQQLFWQCYSWHAVLFLSIATFAEFLCIFVYAFLFPKLPIVKYYRAKAASEGSKTVSADLAAAGIQTNIDESVWNFLLWSDLIQVFIVSVKYYNFLRTIFTFIAGW